MFAGQSDHFREGDFRDFMHYVDPLFVTDDGPHNAVRREPMEAGIDKKLASVDAAALRGHTVLNRTQGWRPQNE